MTVVIRDKILLDVVIRDKKLLGVVIRGKKLLGVVIRGTFFRCFPMSSPGVSQVTK